MAELNNSNAPEENLTEVVPSAKRKAGNTQGEGKKPV